MAYPTNINTSNDSSLFANLVTQAQYQAYESSVARQLVTVFDAPNHTGKNLQVPVWARITAQVITDESVATNAATATSAATITLAEHVVYQQITDMLRDSAYADVFSQIGDQSGRAIAESMDKQVFATFSGFNSDIGTTGHELVVSDLLKAAATLRAQRLTGPFYAVIHPNSAYNLKAALTTTLPYSTANAGNQLGALSDLGNDVLRGFYIGSIAGIEIYESALVTVSGTDAVNGVFAKSALGHAMRGSIDMNTLYLPAYRATDVVMKAVAGATVLNTLHGVAITADARIN
jgi:hypothetical protein